MAIFKRKLNISTRDILGFNPGVQLWFSPRYPVYMTCEQIASMMIVGDGIPSGQQPSRKAQHAAFEYAKKCVEVRKEQKERGEQSHRVPIMVENRNKIAGLPKLDKDGNLIDPMQSRKGQRATEKYRKIYPETEKEEGRIK